GTFVRKGFMNVEFNCGSLMIITAVDGSEWSVSGTDSEGRGPRIRASENTVTIEGTDESTFFADGGRANWMVSVPRTPGTGLGVTLNAGDGTADLAGAFLMSVNLTVNAGSFRLLLDGAAGLGDVNATVNAGSATIRLPAGDRSANLSLNAGDLDVCLPAGAAVRVHWSGALGSNDLDEAGLTEVGDDTWVSTGFDQTQPHLELRVSANASSFGLAIGGACDA
ncbi:MAG: hypothetical protein L0227_13410, partial [Chloroflexi bacterium]|nr:hypothetical protein [Chloroflexota bacterium]